SATSACAGWAAKRPLSRGLSMHLDGLRRDYDIVPVVREMSADALTPVAAFFALSPVPLTPAPLPAVRGEGSGEGSAFLFESVERGENVGRYSFVGFDPRRSLRFDRSTPDP